MRKAKNKFGEGILYNEEDLGNKIYATSAACMSVWSDLLSWANSNKERFVTKIEDADTIILLGCQVTDLSILNDIKIAERLNKEANKEIYLGGCLAQRFDIELPKYIKRLDVIRSINQPLYNRTLVKYEPPFWVKDFKDKPEDMSLREGNLFRNFYPLKIGAGCHGKCKYCTIKHTRGEGYNLDAKSQEKEFLQFDNIVLISDSPTVNQIKDWCEIAIKNNKEISIRNIEPQTLVMCEKEVKKLASKKLLKILHCPIQSLDEEVLTIMNRSVPYTKKAIDIMKEVKKYGTLIATNVIIDYVYEGKYYPNYDKDILDNIFDYWVWNPYFDGNFNIKKAVERSNKYLKET